MNKSLFFYLPFFLIILGEPLTAQYGLRNNGAHIHVSDDAALMVQGAQGDYTNASANGTPGTIDLQGSLYLQGDWTNNATAGSLLWDASGTVVFNGDANQYIRGNRTTSFQTVMLNEDVVVQTPYTLGAVLDLRQGRMFLGQNDLRLGANSTITNYDATHYIVCNDTGALVMEVGAGQAGTLFPLGTSNSYHPIILEQAVGASSGDFRIRVEEGVRNSGYTGADISAYEECVDKTWFISSNVSQVNLSITLQWDADDEHPNFERAACYISHYENGRWDENPIQPAQGSGPFTLSRSGITSLSPFAIAGENDGSALPLDFLSFSGEIAGVDGELIWQTANEVNNYGFVVERSVDALSYDSIGFMPSQTKTNLMGDYLFYDLGAFVENKANAYYYRLRQLDMDGTSSFSKTISLAKTVQSNQADLLVWPNPSSDILNFKAGNQLFMLCKIFDMRGKLVFEKTGGNLKQLNISFLPAGDYVLLLQNRTKTYKVLFQVK